MIEKKWCEWQFICYVGHDVIVILGFFTIRAEGARHLQKCRLRDWNVNFYAQTGQTLSKNTLNA